MTAAAAPTVQMVAVTAIELGERRRPVKQSYVGALADSIEACGLITPITLRGQVRGQRPYRLVAGAHRLAACVSLGWRELPAIVMSLEDLQAELVELDENIRRHDLNALDRALSLARRKDVYEALHPETRHGGDRGNQHTGGRPRQNDKLSFSQTTAQETGLDKRSIERAVQLAGGLTADVVAALRGTAFENNQSALLKIAARPREQQRPIIERLKDDNHPARTVREAVDDIEGRPAPLRQSTLDKQLAQFGQLWSRGGKKFQRAVIRTIEQQLGGEFVLTGSADD